MTPARFIRPLVKAEIDQIEELFRKGKTVRVRRRANAIRLSHKKYTVPQIEEVLGCNHQSIHNWFNAFETGGCAALHDRSRSGRTPIATLEYRSRLVEAIRTSPRKIGYPFTVWTLTRIRAHMAKEMSILLSESRVRQIMKEEGLVFKRPKHTLAGKRDEDAFASVRAILEEAKKGHWNPIPQ